MISIRIHPKMIAALCMALLVNLILFLLVPLLCQEGATSRIMNCIGPVFIAKFDPYTPERPHEQKKILPKAKMPPKKIPELTLNQQMPKPDLPHVSIEPLSLEINTKISQGPLIAVPLVAPSAGPSQPNLQRIFSLGEVDQAPVPIRRIEPLYPYFARIRGITGKVVVRFMVDEKGKISRIEILESEPKGVFEKAVEDALRQWRFKPGIYQKRPVRTWVKVPFVFRLEG